ncbi:MAG: hypothetical protein GX557_15445 [Chloroflexi bacterium]|nr:hypothetical protein [Chloroflexota bacterium]
MRAIDNLEAVLSGRVPERVPFFPYDNKIPRGALARELQNRGMGLCCRRSTVWAEMPHVWTETRRDGDVTTVTHHTPVGSVYSRTRRVRERIDTNTRTVELDGLIKGPADIDVVIYMADDTVYHADSQLYHNLARDLGSDGIIWETGPFGAPYDETRTYYGIYTGLEDWIYAQHDQPEAFGRLVEALERRADRMALLLAQAPARIVSFGALEGNYGPAQFAARTLPFYQKHVPVLQAAGKLCALHAHASNLRGYAEVLKLTGVKVIEAFTPPPVGDLSLAAARAAWGPETIIWVHFPETIFWYGPEQVKDYTLELIRSDPHPESLVLSITEMGTACISDDEGERAFAAGLRALMDALDAYQPQGAGARLAVR